MGTVSPVAGLIGVLYLTEDTFISKINSEAQGVFYRFTKNQFLEFPKL